MNTRSGFSTMDIFLAVLGGAAIGATVAYLTTEKTGKARRAELTKYLNKGKETVDEYVSTGRDKVMAFPEAVRSGATAARETFVDTLRNS
jgi:gas vesicle protein